MPGSYRELPPNRILAPFVECLWTRVIDRTDPRAHLVLPDGCIDILLQGDFDQGLCARLVGTMTRPLAVDPSGPEICIGVRFKPGGLTALLDFDARELTDQHAALSDFEPVFAASIENQLSDQRSLDKQCEIVQQVLASRVIACGRRVDPYIDAVSTLVELRHGIVRIDELSDYAGITRQHLSRLFQRHVGVTTKAFARVVRFRAAVREARRRPGRSWSQVASELGFADQAHLIAEFRRLAGATPAALVR